MGSKMRSRKLTGYFASVVALCAISINMAPQAGAVPTANDLINAIDKGKVLSSGTRVSAALNGQEAYVSTFKNAKATDDDCKIEAVLVAKTLMDLAPSDISRVTVYFYNAMRINKRKVVSVSAGDVKAFGSGQVSQEQLLTSIFIKDEEISDPASKVSAYLQQRETQRARKKIDTYMNGDTLEIIADLDADMSDRDIRYEAMRIAEKSLEKAGTGTGKVKVSFADPIAKGSFRQITFSSSQLKSFDSSVQNALNPMQIEQVTNKIDLQTLEALEGSMRDERAALLKRLQELDKQGVGLGPFIKQYFDIEQMISNGNDEQASEAIKRLSSSVGEQEARTKGAKAPKPTASAAAKGPADILNGVEKVKKSTERWGGDGQGIEKESDILSDPERFIKNRELRFGSAQAADQNRTFGKSLAWVYWTLVDAGKPQDAYKYGKRYLDNKARYHY